MTDIQTMDGLEEVEQTISEKKRKKIKIQLRYLSKYYFVYFCAAAFYLFVECAVNYFAMHNDTGLSAETFNYRILGGLFVALAVCVGIIAIAYAVVPTKLYDNKKLGLIYFGTPRKIKKSVLNIFYYGTILIAAIIMLLEVSHFLGIDLFNSFYFSSSFSIIFIMVFIVASIVLKITSKKLAKSLLVYGSELDQIIADDESNRRIKPFELSSLYNFRAHNRKSLVSLIAIEAAYVIMIILIFCLTAFIPPNPYKMSSIEKIDIGYSSGYVYRMLGKPFDRSENTARVENGTDVTYDTWTWCSSGLAKQIATKTNQLEKLSELENFSEENFEKMEKLTEQILNLELELSMTKCDYVTVNFIDGKVTHAEFRNDYNELEAKEVSVSKILYSVVDNYSSTYTQYSVAPTVARYKTVKEVNVKMYLSGGSMIIKNMTLVTPVTSDNPTVNWYDEYGEHTFTVNFK